jgi:hypothetical protein
MDRTFEAYSSELEVRERSFVDQHLEIERALNQFASVLSSNILMWIDHHSDERVTI